MDEYQEIILKEIIESCRDENTEVSKQEVIKLQKLLNKINKIIVKEKMSEKDNRIYKVITGENAHYNEAYEIIIEILDILRGHPLEIVIQKYEHGKLVVYKGLEKDLSIINNGQYHQVEYDLKNISNNLKRVEVSDSFQRHYENFKGIAQEHIKHTRSLNKKTKKYQYYARANEGHITEAFQRHLLMRHNGEFNNPSILYNEPLTTAEVVILLYYSLGRTGWWQQGDIGYTQIKQENVRLASFTSIADTIQKLQNLFSEENFDVARFKQMFTAQDQAEMTDYKELSNEEKEKLVKEIAKNNRINKGITQSGLLMEMKVDYS